MVKLNSWVKYDVLENGREQFVFEPLERGLGETIGNAMRRVLLSSLGGFAITSLKIDGIQHEFSAIDSVKEDVTEIIANLKKIVLKSEQRDITKLTFVNDKTGDIFASDLFEGSDFVVVNPDQYICRCDESKKINMTFTVEYGTGYRFVEEEDQTELDLISLDANFSPVLRVNHTVHKVRVGDILDNDRLVLDIWGNGSIPADEMVKQASQILLNKFSLFSALNENPNVEESESSSDAVSEQKIENRDIDDLDFSARTANALKRANIMDLNQLLQTKWSELENIKNFGTKCKLEVKEKIKEFGVVLEP